MRGRDIEMVMATQDSTQQLRNLLALCDNSKPKLKAVIEFSYRKHPGKPRAWHLDQIEALLKPKVKAQAVAIDVSEDEVMADKIKLYSNFGFYS
jgi:hypothetical protein